VATWNETVPEDGEDDGSINLADGASPEADLTAQIPHVERIAAEHAARNALAAAGLTVPEAPSAPRVRTVNAPVLLRPVRLTTATADATLTLDPTTQGKNERFGQALFRYLDQQPLAASIAELQDQVDRFDLVYNTQRPHQGLPGRITGQQAWDATEVAQAPRPDRGTAPITPGGSDPQQDTTARRRVRRHSPSVPPGSVSWPSAATAPSTSVASRSWSTATWPPPR